MSDNPAVIDFTLRERCGASTAHDLVAMGRSLVPGARLCVEAAEVARMRPHPHRLPRDLRRSGPDGSFNALYAHYRTDSGGIATRAMLEHVLTVLGSLLKLRQAAE